ncbi:MAG TPA: ferritin-like domain-containing protein [Thermoanaerobaculia bacterium]|nr:ferritin-like domain-containing protein [Thermoanaerobaculia bacterium]
MFGATKFENLKDLYVDELKDLYDAEHQILEALPMMAEKASHTELQQAFRNHLEQTRGQVTRLEQVFQKLGMQPERKTCKAMKGLMAEGQEILKAKGDDDTIDAALIAAAQRVEHYEIAGYGTVRTLAQRLGHEDQARLLQEILNQEGETDKKLTRLAESRVNADAVLA